jgi:putative SOS response-associated peptidase YedK
MCGRFTHLLTWAELIELYGLTSGEATPPPEPEEFRQRYNQAPTEQAPVVRIKSGRRELVMLRWGWGRPSWSPNREWINARSEGIDSARSYAESFRLRRCLVPASGFYEWRKMPSGRRAPHWIGMKDHAPFALAGLWKEMLDPRTGELQDRFVVLTCAPNELMAQLHDRMPVIIGAPDYDAWLSSDPPPLDLLRPYPAEAMTAYEISTKINKAGYDQPDVIDPVSISGGGPAAPELPL